MLQAETQAYRIWIDKENKIASFSEIENGELMEFKNDDIFQSFLLGLSSYRYRFQ